MCFTVEKVTIPNPEGNFNDPFVFDIEFQCTKPLKKPVQWEIIYMGSTENDEKDQELRKVETFPVSVGISRVVFQAKHPDPKLIDLGDFPLTMVVLKGLYNGVEFFKSCWFVGNDEIPGDSYEGVDFSKITRTIDLKDPQVHTTQINWQ